MANTAKTTTVAAAEPTMSVMERLGFEASIALERDTSLARGWKAGNDPAVKAAIETCNAREQARCTAAALKLLS